MLAEIALAAVLASSPAAGKCPEVLQEYVDRVKSHLAEEFSAPEIEKFFGEIFADQRIKICQPPPEKKTEAEKERLWVTLRENILSDEWLEKGKENLTRNRGAFEKAYRDYGVEPEYLNALIGIESLYGTNRGKYLTFNLLYYKLTPAHGDWRRHAEELAEFIKYCKRLPPEKQDCLSITGSYAGAIGFPQFMPLSLHLAQDGDGDGFIDLFDMDDAIYSAAYFLHMHGWKRSKTGALRWYFGRKGSSHYRKIIFTCAEKFKQALADESK